MRPFKIKVTAESDMELASANDRTIAITIDYVIIYLFNLILISLSKDYLQAAVYIQILGILPLLVYKISFETLTGTTVGKRLMNLTVIDNFQNTPSFRYIFKRHIIYLGLVFISICCMLLMQLDFIHIYLQEHFNERTINILGVVISRYIIILIAFIDLVSINKDPTEQNRSIHDRIGQTLVVKIKPKMN